MFNKLNLFTPGKKIRSINIDKMFAIIAINAGKNYVGEIMSWPKATKNTSKNMHYSGQNLYNMRRMSVPTKYSQR